MQWHSAHNEQLPLLYWQSAAFAVYARKSVLRVLTATDSFLYLQRPAMAMAARSFATAAPINVDGLKLTQASAPKPKPSFDSSLSFGTCFSDHMLEIEWDVENGVFPSLLLWLIASSVLAHVAIYPSLPRPPFCVRLFRACMHH